MKNNCKVEQLKNNNKVVKNHFIIKTNEGVYFQSYNSIIAFIPNKADKNNNPYLTPPEWKVKLDQKYWDYSGTTVRYLNVFLNTTKKEIETKIKNGEYILTNLN